MIIVTGYKGTPHISSNDQQGLNQGIFGTGNAVLNVGNKFSATLTDVNTVTISDGEGVMQGVHFRVEPGTTDTVNIENGTSGYNRIDLICARYTKNATTGVENVEWAVITGTPNASTASAPSYNTGDILNGDSPVDFPMFQVTLTGLTPAVTALFDVPKASKIVVTDAVCTLSVTNEENPVSSNTVTLKAGHVYLFYVDGTFGYFGTQDSVGELAGSYSIKDFTNATNLTIKKIYVLSVIDGSSAAGTEMTQLAWYCAPDTDISVGLYAWPAENTLITTSLTMNVVQIA